MQYHRFARPCLLAITACVALGAQANTIWRCGDRYSDVPCEGGRTVETSPQVSADQARRAQETTRSNLQTADMLQRQRLREEGRGQLPVQAVPPMTIPGPQAAADDVLDDRRRRQPESRTGRKPEMFTATVPGTGRQKKAANRGGKEPGMPRKGRSKKR